MTQSEAKKLVPVTQDALPQRQVVSPLDILSQAIANGSGVDTIERVAALAERWQANDARKAFDAAMADAKAEIKPIFKAQKVDFTSAKGRTNYAYEGLDDIAREVDPILAKHGLSYRHRSSQNGKKLTVMCVMSHRGGHREDCAELSADNDESGNKNSIQGVGSAATFLQRYTVKLALGLSTTRDTDARTTSDATGELLSENQLDELRALANEVGADLDAFCRWAKVDCLDAILASKFEMAKAALNAKRRKASA